MPQCLTNLGVGPRSSSARHRPSHRDNIQRVHDRVQDGQVALITSAWHMARRSDWTPAGAAKYGILVCTENMKKRITDNDAFAAGIAAYAMMQALLKRLEDSGMPQLVIRNVIEDAARSLELVSLQLRPKHPAMNGAISLLRGSAAKWSGGDGTRTGDGGDLSQSTGPSAGDNGQDSKRID